ncbi:hypothetical protein [Microbacterium marinilacus]|uniref:Single-stranded DNA-binding protein n=1 Tax=Microbacterium marinilacus TaxID=415209 RepID=A0ABP7B5G8_9MICO|nr:hypothetical protein [Microbacterium marinilacus]MBY0689938.1 hypothetical protein [Microbacterium marinilacus]
MKTFYTSVVELRQQFDGTIETHPYECGWADEAVFFVELHDPEPGTRLVLQTQLSADGIRWLDEGTVVDTLGAAFARVSHFGGFLRLAGTATGQDGRPTRATVSVRLALKG